MNACFRAPLLAAVLSFVGCATVDVPAPPRPGPIPAEPGGIAGYQHGATATKFAVGANGLWTAQFGYTKFRGDRGTVAIRQSNGSVFGVPNARAAGVDMAPYGRSPADHDAFVRDYFTGLGLPADQVHAVRAMTLLEAMGRSNESERSIPRVTAYYSVIGRGVGEVAVAESFAWARADSAGTVVHEGVYWPALPERVVAEAKRFKDVLADAQSRHAFEARLPVAAASGQLVIHHSSAMEDRFDAFVSLDVTSQSMARTADEAKLGYGTERAADGMSVTRHFDLQGVERFLPHETTNLQDKYPAVKTPSR